MQDADTDAADIGNAFEAAFTQPEPSRDDPGGKADEGRPRDEHGRFAPRQEAEPEATQSVEEPKPQPTAADDGVDRDGGQIPSWRLREIREERDRIAAERDAERRELQEYRRQFAAIQRQQQEEAEAPQRPDPIAAPQEFAEYVETVIDRRQAVLEDQFRDNWVNLTFAQQHEQHGEAFDKAMAALGAARSPQIVAEIREAVDPGKALMRWYKRTAAISELGDGGIEGYRKRVRDEFKKDPEFRKEFMAELEAEARGASAPSGRSSNVTDIPSLTRTPGSAARPSDAGGDVFQAAFGGRQRR